MNSEIKLLSDEWVYNGEDLNSYMKNLASNDSSITGIVLDLSNSKLSTNSSYYKIVIPNNITEFKIIGKNTSSDINYIYASLVSEDRGLGGFNCKVENLGLSAENPETDDKGVFIDIAGKIFENELLEEGNTLLFIGNNSILASRTGTEMNEATFNSAIHVGEGKKLSIYFQDDNTKLKCIQNDERCKNPITGILEYYGASGIGGNNEESAGNIIMYTAGEIEVRGGYNSAGIGGGKNGSGGIINISGTGNITVIGGAYGAGIGGGLNGSSGNIGINTYANMKVYGGEGAAGIGSGFMGTTDVIGINAMNDLTVTGGDEGAGIGSGSNGKEGMILIKVGSKLKSIGGLNSAGIGGGYNVSGGNIEISGDGDLISEGGANGAGIGGGLNGNSGNIEISGKVNIGARGGINASAIGAGANGECEDIKIIGSGEISSNAGEINTDDIGSKDSQISNKNRVIVSSSISLTENKNKPKVNQTKIKTKNKNTNEDYVGELLLVLKDKKKNKSFITNTDDLGNLYMYADNHFVDILTSDGKFVARNIDLSKENFEIVLEPNIKYRGINIFR
ncbi:hypothetical protein [uncultured Clostridium sp.]|jgi:hypothetical protein|uniref:hypothetical protein n=3 Tax=Clostridium TaxID=1485 RepID=UPI00260E1AE4|nr:hypothetical protein [uncultured Clostridium sp.]